MKQHKRELTAEYESPDGETYTIHVWDILEPSTDGTDADGNRGWPCWEAVDGGAVSTPDHHDTHDQDTIEAIMDTLIARLENTPVCVAGLS